jgi:hypothetical protein
MIKRKINLCTIYPSIQEIENAEDDAADDACMHGMHEHCDMSRQGLASHGPKLVPISVSLVRGGQG